MTNHGHQYVQRTYVHGGHTYAYAYRESVWHDHPYYVYAPAHYYHSGFYGWACDPWPSHVYYHWGWYGSPWVGYYGGYFAPEAYYPSAAFWLTDYLLAANLQLAYAASQAAYAPPPVYAPEAPAPDYYQQPAAPGYDQAPPATQPAEPEPTPAPSSGPVRLSPEVKQAIAAQVEADLKAQREAASYPDQPPPDASSVALPVLDPTISVFVVADSLTVPTPDGQECELTAGDVLGRLDDTPGDDNAIGVRVTASKQGDCPVSAKPRVQVADLQEMHNRFREQIDNGLRSLAAGGEGLPQAPDAGVTQGEVPPPQPDDRAAAAVQDLQGQGDQTEREISQGR
ncbi:MAG TPA: hypothetical protein VGK20_10205 [Candidatus Binatia bacterium]|jgi:hypothetical protein